MEQVVNFSPDTSLPVNQNGRRPLQVMVYYLPVTIKTIVVTITGYQSLTPAKQTLLLTAITNTISLIRPFVAAADLAIDKNDILDNNKLIASIITAIPGSTFSSVSFTVNGLPLSSYTFINGDIPYLNPAVTYN